MKKPLFYIVGWVIGSSVAAVGIGLFLTIEIFSYSEINRDPTILIRWLSGWAITGTIVGFIKASWDLFKKPAQIPVKEELNLTNQTYSEISGNFSESSKRVKRAAPISIEKLSPTRGIIFPRLPYKFPITFLRPTINCISNK